VARSLDLCLVMIAAVLVCDASPPAIAAPATPEQKAERKKKREEKKAAEKESEKKKGDKQTKPDRPPDPPTKLGKRPPPSTPPSTDGPPLPACPPDNTLTWRSFGAGFLLTWCTGCHSSHLGAGARQDAPEDVNFDTHANFKPRARQVYERAVLEAHAFVQDPNKGSPMPPAGLPTEAERQRLAQWIACGSPNP